MLPLAADGCWWLLLSTESPPPPLFLHASILQARLAKLNKLKEQGASEVAPGATNSIAGLIQPADVDRALRNGNGAAGPSSRPPAANGKPPAEGEYEYEYYDAAAPAAAGDEYEYSYTYTYREGAPAAAQEDAVAQGLSPDEYEYYYEDEPAAAPAAAR